MSKFDVEHVGTRKTDVYRVKPKKKSFDWGAFFGGMILLFFALGLIGSCTG
jgi:hypothetical protein